MDASVTKGTALRELREKLGVRKEEVLAIGDSEKDVYKRQACTFFKSRLWFGVRPKGAEGRKA